MILVDGEKYACQQCIRGHRSSTCKHIKRPLVLVRSRGRPLTDSFQRIAIFAEEIKDDEEKEKLLQNEKNPTSKNLMAAKRIQTSSSTSSCCSHKNAPSSKEQTPDPEDEDDDDDEDDDEVDKRIKEVSAAASATPSCCSSKTQDPVVKIEPTPSNKTVCQCCTNSSSTGCKKKTGPVYVLKAAKRQVYNVEKDSLRLLDPVVEIPNSKVGLDIIQKVSKNKKLHSCKNKKIKEELLNNLGYIGKHVPSSSCCANKCESKLKKLNINNNKTPSLDKNNTPFVYQFQVSMNKPSRSPNAKSALNKISMKETPSTSSCCKHQNDSSEDLNNSNVSTEPPEIKVKLENDSNSDIFEFTNNINMQNIPNLQHIPNMNTFIPNSVNNNFANLNMQQQMPQSNNVFPDVANGLLYDLYIADSCTVPGSCSCEPDKCACPDCTEHSKYRNSNLSVKEQFEEFPFPINDLPTHTDYPLNKDIHGIRPCGKVEMQSSVPLFEQTFLKVLANQQNINPKSAEDVQMYSDTTSQNSNMEECYCEADQCCCYNCIQHGIIDGIRIADGVCIAERTSTPQEIQMLGSQYPLYGASPSSSAQSTPTVMSESEDFLRNPVQSSSALAARSNEYNNFTAQNINNIIQNQNNNNSRANSNANIPIISDKEQWMQHHNTSLYEPQLNTNRMMSNPTGVDDNCGDSTEYTAQTDSTNASISSNIVGPTESVNSQDELISRILNHPHNNFPENFLTQVARDDHTMTSNGTVITNNNINNNNTNNGFPVNDVVLLHSDHLDQIQHKMKCNSILCEKLNCDGNCERT